ncbi:SDR family oxidoreductase [Massilia sp. IC2-476]|uniref:SDR family oxidoreductase n=1 Tax=Massilia sp. IC2-476 TaxID=2887199 RepID=UPI001D100626|nr:SDR family oxidoreductase [Massilia sp. IC2-476]MCC2974923.1 SDR family oxidoreductase [Massilia sp. IC2-476]
MNIQNATVLVTGANRGLGAEFARQALARGASKVYAAARDPSTVGLAGVVPVKLDVTDAAAVGALAADLGDVDLVINNAGIADMKGVLDQDADASLRRMLETNVFGILNVSRAFAPVLARNGGGAFLNVLSVASWISSPVLAAYAVSKSAAWGLTNGLRNELAGQGTQVLALHVGFIDTDLTKGLGVPKLGVATVVDSGFAALEEGRAEVAVDELTQAVKRGLSAEPGIYTLPR